MVEREAPSPGEEEVLVRVEACGVCGTDTHIWRGRFPARFPLIAGHEMAGVVEEVGPRVTYLRTGDHVSLDPNIACGACRPCRRGQTHLCRRLGAIGVTQNGGFATHCLAPARQCYKVPREMAFEVAAMGEPVACCVHGIDRAQVRAGEVVVVIGAGAIGLMLLQLARLQGAAVTIVSELVEEKREAAVRAGATRAVDPMGEDLSEVVREATEGHGPDVVIECVGGAETAQLAVDLAGDAGRVLLFGVAPESDRISVSPYQVYRKEITITGSFTNPFTQQRALGLLASGQVRVDHLISHRLPLERVEEGVELVESATGMKVVVEPQRRAG
jgi:2-desacetyl-2-hydroxyethyl bacteriochlorophyllide A dehydrogenase